MARRHRPSLEDDADSRGHLPDGKWAFDESVTRVFGDMLRRSIPQYAEMRRAVTDLGQSFIRPGTTVVDLGCSRGDALAPFVEAHGADNTYLGLEVSEPMLAAARARFAEAIAAGFVEIRRADLCDAYPDVRACLTLCVLTLQFTPVDQRQRILTDVYQSTLPGGALVLVEKVIGADPGLDALMVERYHRLKSEQGYSREEVERKRLALEGVLVPVTAGQNEALLRDAGFTRCECVWRWMNFAGWLALR